MKSIRLRILIYFISFILMIGVVFVVGINIIDSFYYGKKVETMTMVIDDINKVYEVTATEDEAIMNIEYLGFLFEGKIGIYDSNTNMVIFENKQFHYARGNIISEFKYKDKKAFVYETSYPIDGARWLIHVDQLDNGRFAIVQIPVVAIDQAIVLFQSFFSWILLFGIGLAVFLAIFLSRSLTRPIHQLQKVASNIEALKFDCYYEGDRQDEIGTLGNQLNHISKTLEKTIDDLQEELKKRYNIDKMRRRFVAQVSHELQTPISIIGSYTEALIDGIVEDDEIDSYYQILQDETDKMSTMIKDLLELSQLEAETIKFKKEAINLGTFLDSIVNVWKPVFERDGKKVIYRKSLPDECIIQGDAFKLEQAIRNIMKNAFNYSAGFISITLTESDELIILSIENDGDPIDSHDLPHIFESFYKGKNKQVKGSGTGLGLSIAARIFEHHNMDVTARNSHNGVVFDIMIKE